MLRNWITVAIRSLMRHRTYTAINVLGLAIGLAAALVIAVFVRHELSYDSWHTGSERTHLAWSTQLMPGRAPEPSPVLSLPMGGLLAEQVPGIERVVQTGWARQVLRLGEETRFQPFTLTSSAFFHLFEVDALAGDLSTALDRPWSVVLSETVARSLFGTADVVGRTLATTGGQTLTVSAVVADPPRNSSVLAESYLSLASPIPGLQRLRDNWGMNSFRTFVQLREGAEPATVIPTMQAAAAASVPDYTAPGQGAFSFRMELTPLSRLHLDPTVNWQATSPDVIGAFAALGVLLLAIAAINFVNLSTARSGLRAREVGLRKTLGASRTALVGQFMGEAVVLALIAGFIAVAAVELGLTGFMGMLGVRLEPSFAGLPVLISLALPLALAVGIGGGIYPALVLSGFRPAIAMRGGGAVGGHAAGGGARLRGLLVVLQFAAAIALAAGTWIILDQTRHAQSARLGFDRENVVLLRGIPDGGDIARWEALRTRLRAEPGIVHAAGAAWIPSDQSEATSNYVVLDGPRAGEELIFRTERSDPDYLKTMGTTLLAGRLFDEGRPADRIRRSPDGGGEAMAGGSAAAIVSRSLVDAMAWGTPDQALGRGLTLGRGDGALPLTVIGVVEDVQFGSVRQPKVATVFLAEPSDTSLLVVRVGAGSLPGILDRIDTLWKEAYPDRPVTRQFLDEEVGQLYAAEKRQAWVLGIFAALAVVIACLGLFGLAAFQAERRTKEIGVRKVLGARVRDIVTLLVWQFSRPVLIANLIAWPVAWIAMERWLSGFATRIDLTPVPFAVAGFTALLIAWATVAGHATKVARRRPVTALRID
ncbi:MAG: hypothetical protein RLY86_2012 [Pseudomonadota bacterium]|jgi:putative ABC transport system permease protein